MGIILAVILFSAIIIFHELGHFALAKWNKIRVDEFSLGLGPTIVGKEFKGTKFSLKLLPLGGACMMGEDDADDRSEGSFNSKSVWARISVIAAGPVFNFILALVMASFLIGFAGYMEPVITEVESGYAAEEAGLKAGDRITGINGKKIHLYEELQLYNVTHGSDDTVRLTYERDGKEETVVLQKRQLEGDTMKRMGFTYFGEATKPGIIGAVQYGTYTVKYWIDYTIQSLKMLVTGKVGIDQMSGPVGIVEVVDQTYDAAAPSGVGAIILSMLNLGIFISANLGVMNLLPIPALDGGRLVFLLIEAVRRKRVSPEKEGMVHFAGFAALMILMVFIMYQDIMKLF